MEGSAEEARTSIQSLTRVLKQLHSSSPQAPITEIRRTEKRVAAQLSEHLCSTFVTPMEREDVEALANVLYKIPKAVEKFGERLLLAPQHLEGFELSRQIQMLEQAADVVIKMVRELRHDVSLETIKGHTDLLQQIEGEADKLMIDCIHRLYTGNHNTLGVVIQKDLYELLERIFDRCRDLGNVVFRIVLKYS